MNATPINEELIRNVLRGIIDPEIGCNIVDLGLIYSIKISGPNVAIAMTLTTPGCPMHESIRLGVETALLALDGVADVDVNLVWDPPWNPSMMTEFGRATIGIGSY